MPRPHFVRPRNDKSDHAELDSASQVPPSSDTSCHLLPPMGRRQRCFGFTKPSRGTNEVRGELQSTETLSFRCCSERYRLMRGAAFTLAEVLITLGITGVVAVLTIAPLVQKYRIKQLETAFKHSSSMIEQALLKTVQEYGFSNVTELSNTCGSPAFNKGNIDNNHPQTINYKNCRSEYQTNIIPEMYQDFISNFHIIKSYSFEDCKKLFVNNYISTYYGNNNEQMICYPYNPAGINILENGSSIYTTFSFLYHNQTDGLTLIFDTNGPNKGPNRYGYDIFMYNTGHWTKLCSKENGDIESRFNGRGCYDYALKNQNPDDDTKGYWESLKL